jgi:hypothetical protein
MSVFWKHTWQSQLNDDDDVAMRWQEPSGNSMHIFVDQGEIYLLRFRKTLRLENKLGEFEMVELAVEVGDLNGSRPAPRRSSLTIEFHVNLISLFFFFVSRFFGKAIRRKTKMTTK